jgi:uncharacterized sulfatase
MGHLGVGNIPFVVDDKLRQRFRDDVNSTDILTDRAMEFMDDNQDRPFFLFLNYYKPHLPWKSVPQKDSAPYNSTTISIPDMRRYTNVSFENKDLKILYRKYYSQISCIDRNVGRILDKLQSLGLNDDTLIIFIGDNGFNIGHHGLLGKGNARMLGSQKRRPNMYDHSVKIPFIVKWPKVIKPGSVSKKLVSTIDLFPTLIDVAHCQQKKEHQVDGKSLLPVLRGEKAVKWRDSYCDTYDMTFLDQAKMRMVRTDRWHLILYYDKDGLHKLDENKHELFDLTEDPEELNNLYGRQSLKAVQEDLETRLMSWMHQVGVAN